MKNVLILGANGSLAKVVIPELIKNASLRLTLFSRQIDQLQKWQDHNVIITKGNVLNLPELDAAMTGQDIVYANLSGELEKMAHATIDIMTK